MIISLIGMSNSGKTYWAKKLEKVGFYRFSCDDFIKQKLEKELRNLGFSGIRDVAKWLGQPYQKQYFPNSKKYLDFEIESLKEIMGKVKKGVISENTVIDTTGSVIYSGNKIMEDLAKSSIIIYLDTPSSIKQKIYELYFQSPKPVIWGDRFKKINGESDLETLKLCYPNLLEYRNRKYKRYAKIILDYFLLRKPNFSANDFLTLIGEKL